MAVARLDDYVLGSSDAEYQRLARQAETLAPLTDRLLAFARVGAGQRVLDVGSGVGHVSELIAKRVGTGGTVTAIDRDAQALERARERFAADDLRQIQCIATELADFVPTFRFDAIVGRFVWLFLPDPVAALAHVARWVRPGGMLAFQEPQWDAFMACVAHLPLHSACGRVAVDTLSGAGAHPNMAASLFQGMKRAGVTEPSVQVEVCGARMAGDRRWLPELLMTLSQRWAALRIDASPLGDLATLAQRLDAEACDAGSYSPLVGIVSCWGTLGTHH